MISVQVSIRTVVWLYDIVHLSTDINIDLYHQQRFSIAIKPGWVLKIDFG